MIYRTLETVFGDFVSLLDKYLVFLNLKLDLMGISSPVLIKSHL